MRRIKEMRRTKVLLAGVMAMSLAISSTVVPALGSLTGVERKIVYAADEAEIAVEGMDGENINLNGDQL
jgi:hypothetical protein